MKYIQRYWLSLLVSVLVLVLYRSWFAKGQLSAPDFPYYHAERLGDFAGMPYAWSNIGNLGLGSSTVTTLNLDAYVHAGIQVLVFWLHIPWTIVSRFMFFWPFLLLSTVSAYVLTKAFVFDNVFVAIGALIYVTNTYILMLAGGGQMGLVMAYAVTPFVLWGFMKKQRVVFTTVLFFLVLFDLRFTYITAGIGLLYLLCTFPRTQWWSRLVWCIPSAVIVLGLHLFWIIPSLLSHSFGLPQGYGSSGWLAYLSWAEFSKTISLLHPNWPENIFGKTYFMKPEFLLVPIVAFSSLFFIRHKTKENMQRTSQIKFFVVLALLGAFLAKGVNPPFGGVYEWMFVHVPFFNGFRDPTKFYVPVVLSYTILIPFALQEVAKLISRKHKTWRPLPVANVVAATFVLLWLLLLRPLVMGRIAGTFTRLSVPSDYTLYEKTITQHPIFSRTLAVPWRNRFVFESETHPVVDASTLFQTSDIGKIAMAMKDPNTAQLLRRLAVSYVVIPDDFAHEIFLRDREYDPDIRSQLETQVDRVPVLEKQQGFEGLTVYKVNTPTGLFTRVLPNLDWEIYPYREISPVTYSIDIASLNTPIVLNVATAYDPQWELWVGDKIIRSKKTADGLNSFVIDSNITRQATLHYVGQTYVDWGVTTSFLVLLCLGVYGYIRLPRRFHLRPAVYAIIIVGVLTAVLYNQPRNSYRDVLHNTAIWWSREWASLHNPFLSSDVMVSRYGGTELRFTLRGSRALLIKASSSNNQADIEGIDISIGDKTYTMITPMHNKVLSITPDGYDAGKSYSVKVRHWCAGTLWPCDVAIQEILLDKGAVVSAPSRVPDKMLAVLGDSIAVSFGNSNAMYLLADRLGYQLHNASVFGSTVSVVPNWDSGLLRYQNDITRFKPDVIVVFLGSNDLGFGIPLAVFAANFDKLITGILQGSPQSRVIVLGIMRRKDYLPYQIRAYSNIIASGAGKHRLTYIDPYDWLDPSDLQDVVHPAPRSQPKFAEKLYQYISDALKQ